MKGRNFELGTNSLEGRDSHLTCKLDVFGSTSNFLLFFTSFCSRFSIQLRPLTTQYAISVVAVLQTAGLPEIWRSHTDADVDSSVLGYDSI